MEENLIENRLSALLKPVSPRREFVEGLGNRIHDLRATVAHVPADTWKFILLMLAGFLSLSVLLVFAGRGLISLLSSREPKAAREA